MVLYPVYFLKDLSHTPLCTRGHQCLTLEDTQSLESKRPCAFVPTTRLESILNKNSCARMNQLRYNVPAKTPQRFTTPLCECLVWSLKRSLVTKDKHRFRSTLTRSGQFGGEILVRVQRITNKSQGQVPF